MNSSVGKLLQDAREERDLTLDTISKALFIKVHYLQALENDDMDVFYSRAQMRGFLKAYASYLGLDAEPLLESAIEVLRREDSDTNLDDLNQSHQDEKEDASEETDIPFVRLGEKLRNRRGILGLSLEDVENQTHIKQHYLRAMETGEIDKLPSLVQGRGMLGNYAAFLGLDADSVLLDYAEGIQAHFEKKQLALENKSSKKSHKRKGRRGKVIINRDVLVLGGLLVVFVAIVVLGWSRINALRENSAKNKATVPSISDILVPSATPSPTLTQTPTPRQAEDENGNMTTGVGGVSVEPTKQLIVPVESDGAIQVEIIIRQRAWMRVTQDDEIAFEGRVIPGSAYAFAGDERVEILTGNAAALNVLYNGQDLGVLGFFGEAVDIVITAQGVQTPTPTVTSSPTSTPKSTSIPTFTATP